MTYGSVCSGIEAATVAWEPLGFAPLWFAEVEKFCCAVLKYHYPNVSNHGDFTKIQKDAPRPDVLVGGTPCQSFSVAGGRAGVDDPRGVLAFEFLSLAGRIRPRWIVFENVPGLLSSDKGRDFGAFLGALAKLGYGWAYRILDAQYFGLAQRRERLFVVGYLGDWRPPAAVLFEPESMCWDSPPRRSKGPEVTGASKEPSLVPSVSFALLSGGRLKSPSSETFVQAFTERRRGGGRNLEAQDDLAYALRNAAGGGGSAAQVAIFRGPDFPQGYRVQSVDGPSEGLSSNPNGGMRVSPVCTDGALRRLTPNEWETLQGFPRDYTLIAYRGHPAKDGPRYKALGNSMPVPVMAWIGKRLQIVDRLRGDNAVR